MATVTATRAASTFPVFSPVGSGLLCAAYGSYDFAAEPAAADILEICKVPAGAVILGGFIRAEDLDSDASETIDIDVGYAANGAVAADPDARGWRAAAPARHFEGRPGHADQGHHDHGDLR